MGYLSLFDLILSRFWGKCQGFMQTFFNFFGGERWSRTITAAGGADRNRTCYLIRARDALSQMSYSPNGSGGGSRTHYSRVMSPAKIPICPRNDVERVFRIELKSSDWKSEIIPLYDTRVVGSTSPKFPRLLFLKDIDILLLLQRYRMPFVLLSQIDILLQYPYLLYAHST